MLQSFLLVFFLVDSCLVCTSSVFIEFKLDLEVIILFFLTVRGRNKLIIISIREDKKLLIDDRLIVRDMGIGSCFGCCILFCCWGFLLERVALFLLAPYLLSSSLISRSSSSSSSLSEARTNLSSDILVNGGICGGD